MSQNKQITENIINTIAKHPYLSMFFGMSYGKFALFWFGGKCSSEYSWH